MSVLGDEIATQPAEVARLIDREAAAALRIADALPPFSYALIAARGSSDHAAIYGRYVWGHVARIPVALAAPSLLTLYGRPPRLEGALVVGISQSGQSPDVVAVLEEGRRQGRPTLAITNNPTSPLALAADHVLHLNVVERSIAATRTYTCQLAAVALLAAALSREEERLAEVRALPAAMERTLARAAAPCVEAAARLRGASSLLPIARGINLATAHEMALKLRELLRFSTHAFSAADFRHGSIALLTPGLPVGLIMPSGAAFEDMLSLGRELAAGGATLLALSDHPRAAVDGATLLPHERVPEWLSPLVAILPGQLLALELAAAMGLDPDRPRGLAEKVVRTR